MDANLPNSPGTFFIKSDISVLTMFYSYLYVCFTANLKKPPQQYNFQKTGQLQTETFEKCMFTSNTCPLSV
jgi:hypothetical protein